MSSSDDAEQFADMIIEVAQDLSSSRTVSATLDRITQLAVETVEGCDHAGVLLVRPGRRVDTLASTGELVDASNHAQAELREGPCFDAAREERSYRVVDMRTETRWPRYAPRARELGVGAMMGIRLFAEPHSLAALDLYAAAPYGLTTESDRFAWVFASHAAVAIASSRTGDQLHIND